MMDKSGIVSGILEAFDEIEALKAENGMLRAMQVVTVGADKDIYEYGRMSIFDDYTPYLRSVAYVDGEPQPFDAWFEARFYSFPDFMSRNDFLREYDAELRALYAGELARGEGDGEAEA